MRSRMKKYFAVCGIVFVIGLVLAVVGTVCGGAKGLEKLADRYDWIRGSAGENVVDGNTVGEFDSIEITGDGDVYLVSDKYRDSLGWLEQHELLKAVSQAGAEENIFVARGSKTERPAIEVQKGKLIISTGADSFSGVTVEVDGGGSWQPKILIFCPDKALRSVTVSGNAGDVYVRGLETEKGLFAVNAGDITVCDGKMKKLTAETEAGDVELEGTYQGPTTVSTNYGDVNLEGDFAGVTTITCEAGDVEFTAKQARKKYRLELAANGEVEFKEQGQEKEEFEAAGETSRYKGGPHSLTIKATMGDVELDFAKDED